MLTSRGRGRLLGGSLIIAGIVSPAIAFAQSTPTELADLSLEDLLNLEVPETDHDAERQRWSLSYSYRRLNVGNYKSGRNDLSFDDVLFSPGETRTNTNYPVVPTFIAQNVHAISATYAITDAASLSIAVPYISQGNHHISSVPGFSDFLLSSDGIGDIALTAGFKKRINMVSAIKVNVGMHFPTGSIDELGDTPRNGPGTLERLPYTMQLGSGTHDLTLSLNYSRIKGPFNFGVNVNSTIRTGLNDNGYRLGNNYSVAVWTHFMRIHWLQPGFRVAVRHIGEIRGQDASLLVPAAFPFPASITDPSNFGGEKINTSFTLRSCTTQRCKYSITAEVGKPIYQHLNGVQPKERFNLSVTAGVQF